MVNVVEIVHWRDGQWYFWNETWADEYGPYPTRIEAVKALKEYCKVVLGE